MQLSLNLSSRLNRTLSESETMLVVSDSGDTGLSTKRLPICPGRLREFVLPACPTRASDELLPTRAFGRGRTDMLYPKIVILHLYLLNTCSEYNSFTSTQMYEKIIYCDKLPNIDFDS